MLVRQSGFRFAHFSVIVLFLLQMSYTDAKSDKAGEDGIRLGGGGRLVDMQLGLRPTCSETQIVGIVMNLFNYFSDSHVWVCSC